MNREETHQIETCYHVTVLSNFARAYEKYRRRYNKAAIPESTHPDQFFLLRRDELEIGIEKAGALLKRLARPGDRLLVLKTSVSASELEPNLRTRLGRFVPRNWIGVDEVFYLDDRQELSPQAVEDVCAQSFSSLAGDFTSYDKLTPRSFSVLPEAIGCQAACPFCFSKASVSLERRTNRLTPDRVTEVLREAKQRGATRAVITGGGEPGMLEPEQLENLIRLLSTEFHKTVLITNGFKWSSLEEGERIESLLRLDAAGLKVLAISRHHHDADANAAIMRLNTGSELIAQTWRDNRDRFQHLRLRWICVLQQGGVADDDSLQAYIDWAAESGVEEVCFKELYVSTSSESEYHDHKANRWSYANQVPLSLVPAFADEAGWSESSRLPWGAPIFRGERKGIPMQVAAYTEPSLFWERHHRQCRSWNLMADGRWLASLEDRNSEVMAE